jgi:hypothetical protein
LSRIEDSSQTKSCRLALQYPESFTRRPSPELLTFPTVNGTRAATWRATLGPRAAVARLQPVVPIDAPLSWPTGRESAGAPGILP